jgi:predicted dehydrogenase
MSSVFPPGPIPYAFEARRRLRAALVGCGGQAYRNLLPSLSYAPIDLVATCDQDERRAIAYAERFGATYAMARYEGVLELDDVDAVMLAVGYDADGRPLYPPLVEAALRSGRHVWMEKPPAASVAEVERMAKAASTTQLTVAVGFMKMFSAGASRVAEIISRPEFGRVTSVYLRDPEMLPRREQRDDRASQYFLDHIVHPASLLQLLLGPPEALITSRAWNGAAFVTLRYSTEAVAVVHMPWGQSGTSPMERLEVIGEGANVVYQEGIELVYYPPGNRGSGSSQYGRTADFTTSDDRHAPRMWRMDGYSGQPYNMHVFYQGYAPQLMHFATCALAGEPVRFGSLVDAWYVTRVYEACLEPPGREIQIGTCPFG